MLSDHYLLIIAVVCLVKIAMASNHGRRSQVVRLFLIRHSETVANSESIVLGQSDSPLTDRGKEQARALGLSKWIQETPFDRFYTSDLPRAAQTSQIALEQVLGTAYQERLMLDERLREMAKGAREGFSKLISYEEALKQRRMQDPTDSSLPSRETEDQAWERMYAFVRDVVQQILDEDHDNDDDEPSDPAQSVSHVFCMSHSGISRIFLRRLIGTKQLHSHPQARFDATGLFYIPNTSVTILDVRIRQDAANQENDDSAPADEDDSQCADHDLDVDIVELTWADHLGDGANHAFAE